MAPIKTPENRQWGETLKHTRLARGLTIVALSKVTGIATNTISNWEAGKGLPAKMAGEGSDLSRLCKALGVQPHWLLWRSLEFMRQDVMLELIEYGWDVVNGGAPPASKKRRRGASSSGPKK
jgi:transcriptional regulator with XRE-family HTH domain